MLRKCQRLQLTSLMQRLKQKLFHLTLKEGQVPAASSEIEELIWLKAGDQSRPVALLSQSIQARFLDAV